MNALRLRALQGFRRAISRSLARASEHTVEFLTALAIDFTASKSPFDDAAKPASITSTRSRSSCFAMRSFSSQVIDAPGLCSPSRKVVSKMIKRSVIGGSSKSGRNFSGLARGSGAVVHKLWGRVICARGAAAAAASAAARCN